MVMNASPGLPPESNRLHSAEAPLATHPYENPPQTSNFFELVGVSNPMKSELFNGANIRVLAVLLVGVVTALAAVSWWGNRPETINEASIPTVTSSIVETPALGQEPPTTEVASEIIVHVAGAVAEPGIVSIAQGDRVADAVDAAGGPTLDADLHSLNLAQVLQDGTSVVVPFAGQQTDEPAVRPPVAPAESIDEASSSAQVNVNTASPEELQRLNGVGPATAAAIVEWREANGMFSSPDDLLAVPGIGPAKLGAIVDDVIV